jgi:hypothetical protein
MLRPLIAASLGVMLAAATLGGGTARAEEVSGFGSGTLTPSFNQVGTPLLDQFYFRFTNNDHHFGQMSAYPLSGGKIQIAFQDDSSDFEYFYRVGYQRVSAGGIVRGSFSDACLHSCPHEVARPDGDYVFVLTGFRFYYHGGRDRHFDELGVLENNGIVKTYLNDRAQDNDDTYITYISYAWVPRARFSTVRSISDEVYGEGGVRHEDLPGNKVIRGFRVNDHLEPNSDSDRHIRELGIMTNSDNIEIYNSDNSPGDDDWEYVVRYAALN